MQVRNLQPCDMEEACSLFSAAYRRQCEAVPILDECNGSADKVLKHLKPCSETHPGVVVFNDGKMLGFMTGFFINGLLGTHKGVLSPEWAHASVPENAFEIYRLMYQEIGQQWVEQQCLTHAVIFLNHAHEVRDAFCWNGFGNACMDAIRPIEPISVKLSEVFSVKLLQKNDIPALWDLTDKLNRHLSGSPAFLPYLEPESEEELTTMLDEPGNHVWIARKGHEPVGFMKIAPCSDGAAWIVNGGRKFAVNGAYVKTEYRHYGIARLLLSSIMQWGLENGFERCSVDFEATNPAACRFWLKHFQPVCCSMVRRLDERILNTI